MKLSIVIPNYNYEDFVGKAIESCLAIDWPEVEVIVVDDGSTDNSRQVIEAFGDRIHAIFQPNSTHRVACNEGYAVSTGDYVIFLDSDDLLAPGIAKEIFAIATPTTSKVQVQMERIDGDGNSRGSVFPYFDPLPTPAEIRHWMITTNAYPTPPSSGNAYSRTYLDKIFPLSKEWDDFSDSQLLTAAPLLGDVMTVAKPMAKYRIHGKNESHLMNRPGRFAREIRRADRTFRYAQHVGKTIGIDIPDDVLRKNLHVLQHRIPSVKLAPETHPLEGDTKSRVFGDMVRASFTFEGMSVKNKLLLGVWGALTLALPKPLARKLVSLRFAR
jgi:glycosyltransferase involved in cell wall biosynthesis